jgi:two-component system OmpR family sensor kinase
MFSSPRLDAFRSLRARLIAALVLVIAAVCLVVGVATTAVVGRYQVDQLDARLRLAADRTVAFGHRPGPPVGRGLVDVPGQGAGTLVVRLVRGEVYEAGRRDATGVREDLPARWHPALTGLPVDGRPYTRALGPFGDYRLVATRGRGGEILVTGLPLAEVYSLRNRLVAVTTGVGLGAALLAGLVGAVIVRRTLRPLRRVAATAARVAELPLDRGEVALPVRVPDADTDPRTEVGQVGLALNRMLGHVAAALSARQASETRVRHFVADASHELRTPLAAIRGYAELTRRVGAAVPDEVAHAMRRVESEAVRMTALVEDLLLLARLDSGRPLGQEPVDLQRLIIDAVSDARVAAPRHRWRLDLPDESIAVTGDPARLHQVLANLLANAGTHTPPGTTVTTALGVAADAVTVSVVDDGPGIPAGTLPDVFERFARGDTSRSRTAGGTGLGLAIVAAVVAAHGGGVEVTSRPGRTEFAVRLKRCPSVVAS